MKKNKLLQFIRDFIIMLIIVSIVDYLFYKFKINNSFDIEYIVGFMIGWSIWQIGVLLKKKD